MKKVVSVLTAIMLMISSFSFLAFAEYDEDYDFDSYQWSREELDAGFRFDCVCLIVKPEYSLREFTADDFCPELADRAVWENPHTEEDNKGCVIFDSLYIVYCKEPSEENVIKLYLALRDNQYVGHCQLNFYSEIFPIYPKSPSDIPIYDGYYSPSLSGDGESIEKNMLYNPYYQKYYNELLENSFQLFNKFGKYMGDIDFIEYYTENYLSDVPSYSTLIFKTPENTDLTVREYNESVLKKCVKDENILYVGDTVYAAVVKINYDDSEALCGTEELVYIADAFFTRYEGMLCVAGTYSVGDVVTIAGVDYGTDVHENRVTAADARCVLRYSAGLFNPEPSKRFYFCADMNFDNEINSADARLILRASAGLEETYEYCYSYDIYWCDYFPDILLSE